MKRGIFAAAALLLVPGQVAAAPPQRIMSLKICTDALLLDLVPPSRIASVTFLSREPAALRMWPQGAHVPVNHGTAEEILAAHPDLILTDPWTTSLAQAETLLDEILAMPGHGMLRERYG